MPLLISLAVLAFLLYCLLDVVTTDTAQVRNLPKPAWVVVVAFLPLVGGVVWLLAGRPDRAGFAPGDPPSRDHPSAATARPGANGATHERRGATPRPAPRGPDDDPEFIRALQERLRRERGSDGEDA